MIYKIGLLFFLGFFPNELIQAQTDITIAKDSVYYKIVQESIPCKRRLNKKYEFEILKVFHANQAVQDSINHFFFRLQYECIEGISDLKVDYATFKKALYDLCNDVKNKSESSWTYLNTGEFDIVLNNENIFTVNFTNYGVNGIPNEVFYNFNLKTGTLLESADIFKDNLGSLLNSLKQRIYEIVQVEYKDAVIESDGNNNDAIDMEEIIKAIEDGASFNSLMGYQLSIGEWGLEFHIFIGPYIPNSYFHRNNPYTFYFSFKELEPYLTEEFEELIKLD